MGIHQLFTVKCRLDINILKSKNIENFIFAAPNNLCHEEHLSIYK